MPLFVEKADNKLFLNRTGISRTVKDITWILISTHSHLQFTRWPSSQTDYFVMSSQKSNLTSTVIWFRVLQHATVSSRNLLLSDILLHFLRFSKSTFLVTGQGLASKLCGCGTREHEGFQVSSQTLRCGQTPAPPRSHGVLPNRRSCWLNGQGMCVLVH